MSTRTPARHRGPDPTGAQPPWAESDDTGPGSALLAGDPNRGPSARTGDADSGSALLAGDLGRGPSARTGDLTRGLTVRTGDLTRGLTVRIADLPARPRRHGGPLSSRRPRRGGDLPPRPPGRDGDLPPRPPRRARYLIALVLALPLLGAGGYYLASGNAPAARAASGTVTDRPAPASCAPAQAAPAQAVVGAAASAALAGAMGPAVLTAQAAAPCGGQPLGAVTASPSVPQSAHPAPSRAHSRHPVAGGPASGPSSSSASSSSSAPSSSSPSGPAGSSSPTSSPPSASASSPPGATSGDAAAQVLALINQARSAAGLAPLTATAGLDSSASTHDSTMAGGCGLSHQCPGEAGLGARESAAGVHWTAAGENIGEGGPVANSTSAIAQLAVALTQSMLNEKPPDDGHRLNILSTSFTHIGIAVFRDSSGTVWLTQDFSN